MSLVFGPNVPIEMESVGLSFISSTALQPDTSIASLSAERYVRQNYSHIEYLNLLPLAAKNQNVTVTVTGLGATNATLGLSSLGAFSSSGTVNVRDSGFTIPIMDSLIRVEGINISKGGSWLPEISAGYCVRPYTVTGSELDSSWLKRSFTALGSGYVETGDDIYLIYNVPEVGYGTQNYGAQLTAWPGANVRLKPCRQVVSILAPDTLGYDGSLKEINTITINGTVVFSGNYDGSVANTYILSIDHQLNQIKLNASLNPNDRVELAYLSYSQTYVYSGYRDYNDIWYALDVNPEWGHWTADPRVNELRPSADALLEQVTMYLLPTAYMIVKATKAEEGDDPSYGGTVDIRFVSAFNYGETHFVRHKVGGVADEALIERVSNGSVNTWGYANFGVNRYDEAVQTADDVFDSKQPYIMPLGRLALTAPASINSISVADVRQRGGGLPEDFPMVAVTAQEDGLDRLRGFFDLGNWDGKVVKEGGSIEVQIDSSALDTFDPTEVYEIVRAAVPPGIAFQIVYKSF